MTEVTEQSIKNVRNPSRRRLAALAVAATLGCSIPTGLAAAQPTAAPAAGPAATQTAATRAGLVSPGRWITAVPVAGSTVSGAARALRVTYWSTSIHRLPVISSGLLYTPAGTPPEGGWPVIAWAHGTTGMADICAPSLTKDAAGYGGYVSAWLARGYAVAAADYEGLGTLGRHPYLNGDSAGRSVIDMVRAANGYDKKVSTKYVSVGYSQGGQAALFTGKLEKTYGAGLNYRGTVAIAPPSDWKMLLEHWQAFTPKAQANPLMVLVIAGLNVSRPASFRYSQLFTPLGIGAAGLAETVACANSANALAGKTNDQVFAINKDEANRIVSTLTAIGGPPTSYTKPVLLVQGTADELVPAEGTRQFAGRITTAKELAMYDGVTHMNVLEASLPTVSDWVAAHMR